jgi:hypothetical protein
MKPLFAIALVCASAGAYAQREAHDVQPAADGLHETVYPDPRGNLIVRWGQPAARPQEPRPPFEGLDRNHDGVIDESEAAAYITLANDFIYADANRDHRISRREYDRW